MEINPKKHIKDKDIKLAAVSKNSKKTIEEINEKTESDATKSDETSGFDEVDKVLTKLMKGEKPKTTSKIIKIDGDLSKSQSIILLYIGVTSKTEKKKSLSKKEIKDGLYKELDENLDTKSLNSLVRKNVLEEYDGSFCLSDDGKDVARELLQDIKEKYGDADWDIIKKYFYEQTIKPLSVDKWVREFQKLPENIQDNLTHLSENIKRKKTVSQLTKEFIEILNTDKKVRKIIDDKFKYQTTLAILSNRYTPKIVDLEEILHKDEITDPDEKKILKALAKNNFHSQHLMFSIRRELQKDHVGDQKGKMTAFLVCCSGKLLPEFRVSMALRGDSSVGKTNLMKTVLRHLPKHWYAWGTRFTRASLEDDIEPFFIVVFSEKTQDPDVIEALKQLSEDGLQTWKHDKETNKLRDVKFIDRKASMYSSTKKETDEELATRYIVYTIESFKHKINDVIKNIKKHGKSKLQKERKMREKKPTWITEGLQKLDNFDGFEIPFSNFICYSDDYPRCQRDVKRFMNLMRVSAWINQKNRKHFERDDGKKILVVDPDDFFWASYFTQEIFTQTLSNIDSDTELLISTYDAMVIHEKTIVPKDIKKIKSAFHDRITYNFVKVSYLAMEIGISINTLKDRLEPLEEKGVIVYHPYIGGKRALMCITHNVYKIRLLKYDYEKTYSILKNIQDDLEKTIEYKLKGGIKKEDSIVFKEMKKNNKLEVYFDSNKERVVLKNKKDEYVDLIVKEMNKEIKPKKEPTDFSFNEFESDEVKMDDDEEIEI